MRNAFVYMRGYPSRRARDERLAAAHADPEFTEVVTQVERNPRTRLIQPLWCEEKRTSPTYSHLGPVDIIRREDYPTDYSAIR